jgi:putative transposase
VVTVASADDGTIAPKVLGQLTEEHRSRLKKVWADGKYHNHSLKRWLAKTEADYEIEVVGRPAGSVGFVKLPKRWVVERTFAWLGRYRRNSRDYERSTESSEAMIKACSIHRMLRLLKPDKSKDPIPFKYRKLQEKIETLAPPPGIIVAWRGAVSSSFPCGRDFGHRETCPARSGR